jgi:hypothetical protein
VGIYFEKINLFILTNHILRLISMKTKEDLINLTDDYYLILLSLYDIKYSNIKFWKEFLRYSKLFEGIGREKNSYLEIKLEKIKILSELVMKEHSIE